MYCEHQLVCCTCTSHLSVCTCPENSRFITNQKSIHSVSAVVYCKSVAGLFIFEILEHFQNMQTSCYKDCSSQNRLGTPMHNCNNPNCLVRKRENLQIPEVIYLRRVPFCVVQLEEDGTFLVRRSSFRLNQSRPKVSAPSINEIIKKQDSILRFATACSEDTNRSRTYKYKLVLKGFSLPFKL